MKRAIILFLVIISILLLSTYIQAQSKTSDSSKQTLSTSNVLQNVKKNILEPNTSGGLKARPASWQLVYPNGGEIWYIEHTYEMTWNGPSQEEVPYVWIYMSTNSGNSYYLIGHDIPNTGSCSIHVGSGSCDYCRLRVEAYNSFEGDNSDNDFYICKWWHLTYPNGGETFYVGSTYTITWTGPSQKAVPNVWLYCSTNSGNSWTVFSTSAANTGSYNWTVSSMYVSDKCRIRVENATNIDGDNSDADFTIIGLVGFKDGTSSKSVPSKFEAYPNPFNRSLSVSLTTSGTFYTLSGRLILKLDAGQHRVDTSSWKPGVYLIKCNSDIKKLIKID